MFYELRRKDGHPMIVKPRCGTRRRDLTPDRPYVVIVIEPDDLRLLNDEGRPFLYPARLFRIVDRREPDDWVKSALPSSNPEPRTPNPGFRSGSSQPSEKAVDLAEKGFLLTPCVDGKAGPVCPETNVGEHSLGIFMEVKKGPRFQEEGASALLAKELALAKLLK